MIQRIAVKKTSKPAEWANYRVFIDPTHIKHVKLYGHVSKAASDNDGSCILFQPAAKGWRAESNLPGLTPLIPVSHPPLTALNRAWQREPPSVCQTPTEKRGKTNTCYQDAVIGERKCFKAAQVQRKTQREVQRTWLGGLESAAARLFPLAVATWKQWAQPARGWGCRDIYMYIFICIWAGGMLCSGLAQEVLWKCQVSWRRDGQLQEGGFSSSLV